MFSLLQGTNIIHEYVYVCVTKGKLVSVARNDVWMQTDKNVRAFVYSRRVLVNFSNRYDWLTSEGSLLFGVAGRKTFQARITSTALINIHKAVRSRDLYLLS